MEYSNCKGFICSPKTPDEDRQFFFKCKDKADSLLTLGCSFVSAGRPEIYERTVVKREELAVNATLHRGYYCPSPVFDLLVGNTKRGKILLRPSTRSKFSHRYVFDSNDDLLFVQTFLDSNVAATEYIVHSDSIIYGIAVNRFGELYQVSEEIYSQGRLIEYTLVSYNEISDSYCAHSMNRERYTYDEDGLLDCDWYDVSLAVEYIRHSKYRFKRENGYLVSYSPITADGTQITTGQTVYKITKQRKA